MICFLCFRRLVLTACLLGGFLFQVVQSDDKPIVDGEKWISEVADLVNKRCDMIPHGAAAQMYPAFHEPKGLSDSQKIKIVLDGLKNEKDLKRKLVCLKILVERFPLTTYQQVEMIATKGSYHLEVRRRAIWVAGIMRQAEMIPWLEKLLGDMEPSIREAAIDSLGLCLFPYFTEKFFSSNYSDPMGVSIHGDVPISVSNMFRFNTISIEQLDAHTELAAAQKLARSGVSKNLKSIGDEKTKERVAKKLQDIMVRGRTRAERIAAARALAGYKPNEYRLRAAEWGVWIESEGQLQLAKTVLDEIPPITYHTTKQISELKQRINQMIIITKPILHLKVDRPLSVNVNAYLRNGQVWFSYPQPNDFGLKVSNRHRQREVTDGDFVEVKKTSQAEGNKWKPFGDQAHEGYPFLYPKASTVGGFGGRGGFVSSVNQVEAMGVRWHHLIVTPKQRSWMFEQEVSDKYRWWSDLRKVDSAWISNGIESEKFIYYDGPTKLPSPIVIERAANRNFVFHYYGVLLKKASEVDVKQELTVPLGLIIDVKDGKITGTKVKFDYELKRTTGLDQRKKKLNLGDVNHLTADYAGTAKHTLNEQQVRAALLEMLQTKNGLQDDEAKGLINSWSNQLFKTEGRRLLVRIRRQDYDFQCPLEITPAPTSLSRVGLVLLELGEDIR